MNLSLFAGRQSSIFSVTPESGLELPWINKKIVTYLAGRNTLRLLPPYIIIKKHISQFMQSFTVVINELHWD